jgi:hypothetical protein
MSELPRWVWEIVADLLDEEDVHPKLFNEDGVLLDWCPRVVLEKVPPGVRQAADAVRTYRRATDGSSP